MTCYKFFRHTFFSVFGLTFFSVFLLNSNSVGQLNPPHSKSVDIDLRVPLRQCFQIEVNKILPTRIASDNVNSLFIGLQEGKIIKINLKTKSPAWNSDLGGEINSDLIYEENRVFLVTKLKDEKENIKWSKESAGNGQYLLWAIDAGTGITVWQFPFTANGIVTFNSFQYKLLLTTSAGTIISVNKFDGGKNFDKYSGYKFGSVPIFSSNKLYVAADNNTIVVVSADNGEPVSQISTFQSPAINMITYGDNIYWGEKEGYVNSVNLYSRHRVWSIRQGGEISSLTLISNGILVSSVDNFIYLISLQKGKRIWKKRLAGRISFNPLIVGNFTVIITAGENSAVALDLKDGKIVNKIYFADNEFILSAPLIFQNLLIFPTVKGISVFALDNSKCS